MSIAEATSQAQSIFEPLWHFKWDADQDNKGHKVYLPGSSLGFQNVNSSGADPQWTQIQATLKSLFLNAIQGVLFPDDDSSKMSAAVVAAMQLAYTTSAPGQWLEFPILVQTSTQNYDLTWSLINLQSGGPPANKSVAFVGYALAIFARFSTLDELNIIVQPGHTAPAYAPHITHHAPTSSAHAGGGNGHDHGRSQH